MMTPNPFRNCLNLLDEAEIAYFQLGDADAFGAWAKAHAGLLRGAMMMLADEVDEARRVSRAATDQFKDSSSLVSRFLTP